jgi:RsiW-degrading membrane proteinase PrsW (M82 family)
MALDPVAVLVILAVSAFTPPLVFLGVVRRTERYGREPLGRVLRTFLWGAIFAVIVAVILSTVLYVVYQEIDRVYVFSGRFANLETIVLALLIAPLTEEFAKGVGVYLARPIIDEPEDGLVYGAASGLGFAASENLLYGLTALLLPEGSLELSLLVIGVRSVSSALLHASSTAAFGYGIALRRLWPHRFRALPYYLLAVAMHSAYNFTASLGELERDALGENAALIGLLGAIVLALVAFTAIRAKIRTSDDLRVTW